MRKLYIGDPFPKCCTRPKRLTNTNEAAFRLMVNAVAETGINWIPSRRIVIHLCKTLRRYGYYIEQP